MEEGAKGPQNTLQRMRVSLMSLLNPDRMLIFPPFDPRLRWAKKEKKRTQGPGQNQTSPLLNGAGSVSAHSITSQ